jgi:hypothetical protein
LSFIFGAVVVLPYSIYEYFQKKEAARIEQTLSFFRQYNSPPLITYREMLSTAIETNKDKLVAAAKSEAELQKTIVEILKTSQNESRLLLLFDFFDSLTVCVINRICDAETSRGLFRRHARELFVTYYQYIDLQRKTTAAPDFAVGLETFTK